MFISFIFNFFPYKVNSVERFVQAIKKNPYERVEIRPYEKPRQVVSTKRAGLLGTFDLMLEFKAQKRTSRTVIYEKFLFDRHGSQSGLYDVRDRMRCYEDQYCIAEATRLKLQEQLPGIEVVIVNPFSEED